MLNTYRLAPHSKGDDTRADSELATYRARDPLRRIEATLPDARRQEIDVAIEARLEAAVALAMAGEPQSLDSFRQHGGGWQP